MTLKGIARIGSLLLLCVSNAEALESGLPSKTAILVAAVRAIGAKDPDPRFRNPDYLAIKFLGPRERAILSAYPMDALDLDFDAALRRIPNPSNVLSQVSRTKFFDAALVDALRKGARQVVVLGAGFDSRGYRFQSRLTGKRFFEVDYGPTQEYKKERVKEILGALPVSVRYVPIDFTKDSLLEQLSKAGYSQREKTVFIWEGVVYYLPESSVKSTLQFVRDHAAVGSLIAFDYPLSRDINVNNPRSLYARLGEPWLFGFPGEGAAGYVRAEGLEVVSDELTDVDAGKCIARVPSRQR